MEKNKLVSSIIIVLIFIAIIVIAWPYMSKKPAATNTATNTMETQTLPDGLKITILTPGSGVAAKMGDTVSVNYTGMLEDGKVFDSNVDPKFGHVQPFDVENLGQAMVIKGWNEGLIGMQVGEKRRLYIPAELGYGARGAGAAIPPNANLVFEVEVLKIN